MVFLGGCCANCRNLRKRAKYAPPPKAQASWRLFTLRSCHVCKSVAKMVRKQVKMSLVLHHILTFFHADFGKEFPSPILWRGPFLKLPLSKLCTVPFALQNRALFEGEKGAKRCPEKGRNRGGQQRGQKGKKDAWKQVRLGSRQSCHLKFPKPGKIKSNSKVTKGEFQGLPQSNPKVTPKVTFLPRKKSLFSHF